MTSVREYVLFVFFQISKKHDFLRFFEMTYQKVVKSHKKCQVFWISIEILASKLPDVMGIYRRLSHTVLSCIVSCVRTSEMFDVGDRDLPVLTSGNWLIKCWVIKWPVKLYLRFLTFLTFFQNPKMTFYIFLSCCTRFLEHWLWPRGLCPWGVRSGIRPCVSVNVSLIMSTIATDWSFTEGVTSLLPAVSLYPSATAALIDAVCKPTRKLSCRKDDRTMRPIYTQNFIHHKIW